MQLPLYKKEWYQPSKHVPNVKETSLLESSHYMESAGEKPEGSHNQRRWRPLYLGGQEVQLGDAIWLSCKLKTKKMPQPSGNNSPPPTRLATYISCIYKSIDPL